MPYYLDYGKNKLKYIKNRFEQIKKEMRKRGFKTDKSLSLAGFERKLIKNWSPRKDDFKIIRKRLIHKISLKPGFYRYYGKYRKKSFLVSLIKKQ